ncbi:hypothetical protein AAG906_000757 [Vitis piasezkii]
MIDQFKIDKSIAPEEAQIMQKAPEEAHNEHEASEEAHIEQEALEEAHVPENCEISVSYRPGIDYEETYSPIMDAITFRFLISLAFLEGLDVCLMDPHSMYSIKLQRSLYGLKQSGRMWYNRLSEYLLKEGYVNKPICSCIFIKKSETGFAIIVVYVDDLNLVGTPEELTRTTNYLKKEFEMKDLGNFFFLGLQVEYFPNRVLVHQSTYIKKVLKHFYMDKAHLLSSSMVVQSLDAKKDPFCPCEKDEELLGPEIPYLSAIGALMYFANCTHTFRSNSKTLELYQTYIALFSRNYRYESILLKRIKATIAWISDAWISFDPHKGRSQTGYVFNCNGIAISWRFVKQTIVTTSSNHLK